MTGNAETIRDQCAEAVKHLMATAPTAAEAPRELASLIRAGLAQPTADAAGKRQQHDSGPDKAA
jgi:hypothetical protein